MVAFREGKGIGEGKAAGTVGDEECRNKMARATQRTPGGKRQPFFGLAFELKTVKSRVVRVLWLRNDVMILLSLIDCRCSLCCWLFAPFDLTVLQFNN